MVILEKYGNIYIERWKDGNIYKVQRIKGKFISIEKVFIEKYEEPPRIRKKYFKYDFVIRVSYLTSRSGHGRIGEIFGTIYSKHPIRDREVIDKAIDLVTGRDRWIDYVPINNVTTIYISERETEEYYEDDVMFRDLGSV